jgi:hypothetical protein
MVDGTLVGKGHDSWCTRGLRRECQVLVTSTGAGPFATVLASNATGWASSRHERAQMLLDWRVS